MKSKNVLLGFVSVLLLSGAGTGIVQSAERMPEKNQPVSRFKPDKKFFLDMKKSEKRDRNPQTPTPSAPTAGKGVNDSIFSRNG